MARVSNKQKQRNLIQGISYLVSGGIGAGVFGIPYVIAQVGVSVGLLYMLVVGLLMIGFNLLVGEILVRTRRHYHMVGLAKKYLGTVGKFTMVFIMYTMSFGVLIAYIIGEGAILAALFGGSSFVWSLIFFIIASILVYLGVRTVRMVEMIVTVAIISIVILMAGLSVPHFEVSHFLYSNLAKLILPYGVLLFAFSSATTLPEVELLFTKQNANFRRAVVAAGLIVMCIYALFAVTVVGVTGLNTTEVATVGLENALGRYAFIIGNVFALVAMGNAFVVGGLALKDSFTWDFRASRVAATLTALGIPLIFFLAGLRSFIEVIDLIGGVFVSTEMILVIIIYWRAKQIGDLPPGRFKLHHTLFLALLLLIALVLGAVYSVFKIF